MKAHSPCFLWWPKDILADEAVGGLSIAEEGAYRRLLDHCWLEGSITSDPIRLARLVRWEADLSTDEGKAKAEGLRATLAPFFDECPDTGRWTSARMERVREKALQEAEARRDAGKRGAEARWRDRDADSSANERKGGPNGRLQRIE